MRIALPVIGLAMFALASTKGGGISRELEAALRQAEQSGESVAVVLSPTGTAEIGMPGPFSALESLPGNARPTAIILALQERFRASLSGVMTRLQSHPGISGLRGYWAGSMIAFRAPAHFIREIAADPGYELGLDFPMELPRARPRSAPPSGARAAEGGLRVINAPRLWALGITGEGVTIMSLDTGVELEHPALNSSWRGHHAPSSEAWFDPVYGSERPHDYGIDPAGHGTMTAGVMVGLDPRTSDTVGVAFGADWIAAGDSVISISTQVACLQWAMDPDGNPLTVDDMPDVVNCSWTRANPGCKQTGLTQAISALEAAGVAVVFAAGNAGPLPGSVRWPARMSTTETDVFSVGYLDGNDPLLTVGEASSRGPTECAGLGNLIKPEVVAPGQDVRTSWLNGQYAIVSGSSFSAPHVSGALALLKQAFPERSGTELKLLLMHSARDLGQEGEDNDYGSGCIDVYAAYLRGQATTASSVPSHNFSLGVNYPNPFNPRTQIAYEVSVRTWVRITIHTLLGVEIARPLDGTIDAGSHRVDFDGSGFPSGVYVCRMVAEGFERSRTLLLLR